jgi:hypothetical protein
VAYHHGSNHHDLCFHLRSVDLGDQKAGEDQSIHPSEVLEGDFDVGCCVIEVAPPETG